MQFIQRKVTLNKCLKFKMPKVPKIVERAFSMIDSISNVQTAFFVFAAAATGAGIVASRFRTRSDRCGHCRRCLGFMGLLAPQIGQFLDERPAVVKEAFITGAQIVQSRLSVRGLNQAVFGTLTIAQVADFTRSTIPG